MICQIAGRIKTLNEEIEKISFEDLYKRFLDAVRSRRAWFYIPGSERYCRADEYILNGGYMRERIKDRNHLGVLLRHLHKGILLATLL